MANGTAQPHSGPRSWRLFFFSGGVIALLWALALLIVVLLAPTVSQAARIDAPQTFGDLATLLFGATSIALFILSFVISIAAIVGWSHIRQSIREDVEKASGEVNRSLRDESAEVNRALRNETEKVVRDLKGEIAQAVAGLKGDLDLLAIEARGRNLSIFGNMLGKLALKPDKPELAVGKEEFLRDAVDACQGALDLLEKIGGKGAFLALNNLVFYSSIQAGSNALPVPGWRAQSRTWLLAKSKVLKQAALEHQDGSPRTIPLLLTYCCATSLFSAETKELRDSLAIAEEVLARDDASLEQKREARYYRDSLLETLARLSAPES